MDKFSFLNAAHTGFIADLYDQYLKTRRSWTKLEKLFSRYDLANENYSLTDDEDSLQKFQKKLEKNFCCRLD